MATCVCASDLRQRIELQSVSPSRDRIGGLVETWSTYATVAAQVRQANGREVWYRQQQNASASWTISIRYRAGLVPQHRVRYGTRIFEIRSVIDIDERHQWLALACDELVVH